MFNLTKEQLIEMEAKQLLESLETVKQISEEEMKIRDSKTPLQEAIKYIQKQKENEI